MKRVILFLIVLSVSTAQAQQKLQSRHFVTLSMGDIIQLSLGNNSNGSTSAERKLTINSNVPFNIVVGEKYDVPTYSFAPRLYTDETAFAEETNIGHGPYTPLSHLTAIRNITYYRDYGSDYYLKVYLYTAAPL